MDLCLAIDSIYDVGRHLMSAYIMNATKNRMISDRISLLIINFRTVSTPQQIILQRQTGLPVCPLFSNIYENRDKLVEFDILDLVLPIIECSDIRSYSVHVNSLC